MIFVDGENATAADPCDPLTSILMPETESIDPLTSSSPLTFDGDGGDAAADVLVGATAAVVVGAGDGSLGELLSEEPQAANESVEIATIAVIARWAVDVRMAVPHPGWWFDLICVSSGGMRDKVNTLRTP